MKAMILAAGFGKRLLPFTSILPKSLFPVDETVLIDIIINQLKDAGVSEIIINTHHLHQKIKAYIENNNYEIPVYTRFEPEALDTGGAIKNVEDFWDDKPFIVMNCDIITDINLKKVYNFHIKNNAKATLVLHNCEEFNKVSINNDNFIQSFDYKDKKSSLLTFTGIQILDPSLLKMIPENCFYSIIDLYKTMIKNSMTIKAFISEENYWKDLGTPQRYKEAIIDKIAHKAFTKAFPNDNFIKINNQNQCNFSLTTLKGDGSDRIFQRIKWHDKSLIIADHKITCTPETTEIDAFLKIGYHLKESGIPVPAIYGSDRFSGLVFLEDLGEKHLQDFIIAADNKNTIKDLYKKVIDFLVDMSVNGYKKFDLSWTYQTCDYSQDMIIEDECHYFLNSFLNNYLGMDIAFTKISNIGNTSNMENLEYKKDATIKKQNLEDEFKILAKRALENAQTGFMHRDFQSRNIMIKKGKIFFIDFQGGRKGPIQYDLASLLIDPYVELSSDLQKEFLNYCIESLQKQTTIDKDKFIACFNYCAITRNLQMLGAFAHLSKNMNKKQFEQYIPTALQTLKNNIKKLGSSDFPILTQIITDINL